jgi:PAS domain S-box-containing protein
VTETDLYKTTIDALPASLCVLDAHGVILLTNAAWRKFADENPPAPSNYAVSQNYLTVCDQAEGENSIEAKPFADGIRSVLGGATGYFELTYPCHAPGKTRWFIGRVAALSANGAGRVVITHNDVTLHHLAEIALRESESLYRETVSSISDAIFLTDEEHRFVHICSNVSVIFGWSVEETLALGTLPRLLGPDIPLPKNLPSEIHNVEWSILDKAGCVHQLLASMKPVRIGKGTRLFTCRDITGRMQDEKRLRDAEKRYRTLFEHSGTGIVIIDRNGVYQVVNEQAARVMGSLPADIVGKSICDFFPADIAQKYIKQNREIIDSGIGRDYEASFHLGGSEKSFLISDRCLTDGEGLGIALQSSSLEITDLKRAQDELRALTGHLQLAREEERRSIAREIHDHFSQVLSALKIDLSLVIKDIEQHDEEEFCTRIARQLASFDETLESIILDLRQIVARLRPEILETIGILATMEFEVREFGRSTGLLARFTSNVGHQIVDLDTSIALYRILQESLTNVRLHAQAKSVLVSLEQTGDALVLQIEDDGRGFPTDSSPRPIPYGILGMKERALLLKGDLSIARTPTGKTVVSVSIPFRSGKQRKDR